MLDRLICPDCKNQIVKGDNLKCVKCGRNFEIKNGVIVLIPKKLSDLKKTEINFYEKEFEDQKGGFKFVEMYWDKNFLGLLDFMDVFKRLPKDSKILELGAGNGQYSLILKKRGFKNTFISDISIKGLAAAKRYMKCEDDCFFAVDAENIPFQSGTFDVIFMAASLHHLQSPQRCIAEMKRCVKKGGLVIVALEPNSWYYYVIRPISGLLRLRRINKSKDSYSAGDEITHGFPLRRLEKYFKDEGIEIIKRQRVWYTTGIVYYFPYLIERLFLKKISTEPKTKEHWVAPFTMKIDKLIEKIPLISSFSFHNTIIGRKKK